MRDQNATATLVDIDIILLTFLRENITLDIHDVEEGWSLAQQLSPKKEKVVLLKTGKWTLLDKNARDFVTNELKTWPYVAVLVDNLGQRIMGNVVINLTGKSQRIRLFEKEEKALEWLSLQIS